MIRSRPVRRTVLALSVVAATVLPVRPAAADRLSEALADYRQGHHQEAAAVVEPLARAGNADAQFWLGTMYYHGRGRPRIFREALSWYRRAAERGQADAENNLGLMYRNGEGVERSALVAYAWFALAAGHDSAVGRANLDALSETLRPDQILQAQQLAEEYAARAGSVRRRPAPALPAVEADLLVVQVGLFQSADSVRRVIDTLRRAKLPLRDEVVTIRGAAHHRVRVGPYRTAADARAAARRIDSLLKVESAVVPVPRRG